MWNFFKKIFLVGQNFDQISDHQTSIQKMVNYNSLNKRKNTRVNYPHLGGSGPYPRVFYLGSEMIVANISVGGLLIIDDTEAFGTKIGEVVVLELVWDNFSTKVRTRIVSAQLRRRHLQFEDFNAAIFLRITRLVKPGYLGNRFHRVKDDSGSLQAHELWVGPTGESLTIYKTEVFAELVIQGEKLIFKKDSTKICTKNQEIAPVELLEEAFVLIANLPEATASTKILIETLEFAIRNKNEKKTGTNG